MNTMKIRYRLAGLVLAVLMAGASAQAQLTTNQYLATAPATGTNSWSTPTYWTGNVVPDSSTVVASLTRDFTSAYTINISNSITLAGLRAEDTGALSDVNMIIGSNDANSKITFAAPASTIQYVGSISANIIQIKPSIALASGTTLSRIGGTTGQLRIVGDISGGANTTIQGRGLELFGNNSEFNGALNIDGGTMRARGNTPDTYGTNFAGVLGNTATNLTVQNGGILAIHSWMSATPITNSKPMILNSANLTSGALAFQSSSNTVLAGAITLQTNTAITYTPALMAAHNTIAGVIGDDGNRSLTFGATVSASTLFTNTDPTVTGGDTELILTGANTYGGDTYITAASAATNSFKTFYVRVQGNNRLPPTTKLYLGGTSSSAFTAVADANGTLILDGNQTLAGLYTGTSAGTSSRVEGGNSSTSMLTLDIASGTTNVYDGFIGSDRANGNKIQLVKTGSGQLTLITTNTYADGTIVSNGTLAVDGKIDGLVTVDAGATLMGSGTIGGATTVNGMLNPGNSPGTLNFDAALTLGSNSTTTLEIATSSYDVLKNDGNDTLTFNSGATIIFDFTANSNAVKGAQFHVLQGWSSIVTNGAVFQTVGLSTAGLFGELDAGTGIVTVIPEPATIGMLGLGALVTLLIRRMRTA